MTTTFGSLTRITVLSLGMAALSATFAAAQSAIESLQGIPSFASSINGKTVSITANGARREGRVTSLNQTALVMVENGATLTIPYDQIVRVEKTSHTLRKATLVGLATGAGAGLALVGGVCGGGGYCYPSDWIVVPAFYGGLGAAAGVGIGAIVKAATRHGHVIYDSQWSTKTIAVAPILSPTRKGLAFSMNWH